MILNAVGKWRRLTPDKRWTESLDGWSGDFSRAPAHVEAAVRDAYPMPTTYQQALAEWEYWVQRDEDLLIAQNIDVRSYKGEGLDLSVMLRHDLVHNLVLHDMPLTELRDVVDRLRRCREEDFNSKEVSDALLRDLDFIAERSPPQAEVSSEASSPLNSRVMISLKRDPSRSNREIAREVGCSPTIVGRVRKEAGLDGEIRIVRRKGQTYRMRRKTVQTPDN